MEFDKDVVRKQGRPMESALAAGTGIDLRQESDEDLLVYMTMRNDDLSVANSALSEFYERHKGYLYRVCRRLTTGVLDESGAADLVQDTFIRAYERASTFDSEGITNPDRLQRRVKAWLGRIALNIFRDMLRGRAGIREVSLDDEEISKEPEQTALPSTISSDRRLLDEAIDSLSEKEQRVLRTTFQYFQPGKKNQRLPNDVAEDLAKSLTTTSDNIRQIRRRALRKIKEYINSKTGLKKT
jgi:RNA polymerase sigma factor (sigma-70 family)